MVRKHVANFLLASSLALGLTPLALAQPMEERGMERGRHAMQLRTLGLSEAQQDQVFKIFHDSRPAVYEQIKQLRRARQLADAQGKAMAELALLRVQTMRRVREVLTPEQRERMDQMRERGGRNMSRGPRQ